MDEIEHFYHRHPYPQVDQVEYDLNLVDHLFYLAHRCGALRAARRSGRPGRLLVAGCGTREAVMWALCAPHFQIDAVDLSADSIAIASKLAEQLGVRDRIQFTRGRLEEGAGMDGTYDLISSFGVLHHLPDPGAGLARLKRALAPDGVMALMMYSHTNRRPLQEARRVVELLAEAPGLPTDRGEHTEAVALSLCQTGATQPNRLQGVFRSGVHDFDTHRAQFADTLLNPREVSYSVPELRDLLERHGLAFLGPVVPADWRPLHLLPPQAHASFQSLPLVEQMEIADLLTSPLLWVLAGHPEDRRRPCDTEASLFWSRVPMPLEAGTWPVSRLRVAEAPVPVRLDAHALDEDRVMLRRNPRHRGVFHRIARHMVERIDGTSTLEALAVAAAEAEGTRFELVSETLARYWRRIIDELALATPDVTRCSGCPQRCER